MQNSMKILYVGDITGRLGRDTLKSVLREVVQETGADFVIAQGENVSHGKGLQSNHADELQAAGVDFFTGGNHSLARVDVLDRLNVTRPANWKGSNPGAGFRLIDTPHGKVLIISLQGQIVGMDAAKDLDNPLEVIDRILHDHEGVQRAATIVNFHGDYSSEKVVIGQYLDGRVSAVIGDHWHVPTADAQVQPKGTAHISDVGMVGALDSSLGVTTDIIISRWKQPEVRVRNEMEQNGRRQFNAVLLDIDTKTGLSRSIKLIRKVMAS
jgi:metallophosphoesterase (TIGR00282 family)